MSGASSSAEPTSGPLPDLPDITLAPKPISRGPFAAVYRGWDRVRRCDVIVKVQRATGDPIAAERFRREAAVMKRLRHPNIVALYAFHEGDPAALVLEYVPGRTLADLVGADGWLAPARAALIIEGIAAALDCAHAQGVIHRDVKPSNILLPPRGLARLSDFGVAHIGEDAPLTVMGDILGTIEYASPEQVHGNEAPDARSDVYSLAAVAYFALTGTPPFRAADNSTQAQLSVMHRQVFAEPPPLRLQREDLSPEIEAAVLRGLAKAPASRYPSAGQFAATLRAAAEAGAGAPERYAVAAASRRTGAWAGALAGGTLLCLAAFALWRTGQFAVPHSVSPKQFAQGTHPPKALSHPATMPPPHMTAIGPAPVSHPAPKPPVAAAKLPAPSPVHKTVIAAQPPKPVKTARRSVPVSAKPARRLLAAAVAPPAHRKPLAMPKRSRLAAQVITPRAAPKTAWLSVYARQSVAPFGSQAHTAAVPAQSVWVDGYRASDLAAGRWTSLPAGRHLVSFVPDPKSGFAPHKNVLVMLMPGAHLRKQILLPVMIGAGKPLIAALPATPAAHAVGCYTVSGWVPVNTPGHHSTLARASAQWVKVDGRPVPALALGQWAQLPAGKHVVMFQPTPALGIAPKTWNITLTPQAHLNQQIPLLSAPPVGWLSVSGWLPITTQPGQKAQLLPVAAEWVKIDGIPSPELAHGQWVSLPAGRHVLVFQPAAGSGADPATRVIVLSPQAHLNQLVPLPPAPLPATPLHLRTP